MLRSFAFLPAFFGFALAALAGCGGSVGDAGNGDVTGAGNGTGDAASAAPLRGSITVYSGRSEGLVGKLFEKFQRETGVSVNVVYDRTPVLAQRIANERQQSPADVFFAQDPGYLGALAEAGLLADLPADTLAVVDERMRDENGRWVGTSARLRVLVHDPSRIPASQMPRRLQDLADPRYTSLGWAPGNGSLHAHISALRHLWGDEDTKALLASIKQRDAVRFDGNRPQLAAVANGTIEIGWVNHYYLHPLRAQGVTNVENYSFPEGDAGNVMMVAGAGILKTSRNPAAARALVNFLLSDEAQTYFAQETFEYPTRVGVPTHADLVPISDLRLADVPQRALADVGPTIEMLRELGLQ